jgi:hypothetical protein
MRQTARIHIDTMIKSTLLIQTLIDIFIGAMLPNIVVRTIIKVSLRLGLITAPQLG